MARRRIPVSNPPPVVRLWILRLLVNLGGLKRFVHAHGYQCEVVAEALRLDITTDDFDPHSARAAVSALHRTAERRPASVPARLRRNVIKLSELVGLNETDCRIIEFAVLLHTERALEDAVDLLFNVTSTKQAHRMLSVALDMPEHRVRAAIGPQSAIARSGVIEIKQHSEAVLSTRLDFPSREFADALLCSEADPIVLLKDMVNRGSPAHLSSNDFAHAARELAILRTYLRHAVSVGRKGVNILIYGAPGTGKSQLSKILAAESGCELLEVAVGDGDGDPIAAVFRLRSYRMAQSFFARRRALIVFDEAEDVFNDWEAPLSRKSAAQVHKGWMNRTLEDNALPTVWLSNSTWGLDPALVRRFDMVIELPVPPKRQRERILQQACGDLLDAAPLKRIAEHESLAPAIASRAASVVRAIRDELDGNAAAQALESLINNTLVVQGHKPIPRHDADRLPDTYDPAFIHADADLARVAAGIVATKSGRLCLFGPPGTGKTAYGRGLAEQLGVPLMVKRASDLLSMWVGQAEKNIARAFREAEQDGALLLVDEVDSFLQDRRGDRQSWEISQVNEMLTQMESFPGVFIASTNLMEGLDQAALRRFDLKVRFDFLRPDQACELLRRHCRELGLPEPEAESLQRIRRLNRLTPGDFAAVLRQHRFRTLASPEHLVAALESECALKEGSKAAIGFLA